MSWFVPPPPADPITPPDAERAFWEAAERNREATIHARMSQRQLRRQQPPELNTIGDLLKRMERQERGEE